MRTAPGTVLACGLLALAASATAGDIKGVVKLERALDAERTVVYVESVPDGSFSAVSSPGRLSQKGARFRPPLLPVVKGTIIDMTNDDWVSHNIYSKSKAKTFDLGIYGQDVKKSVTFEALGVVEVQCSIHPRMNAEILVLQNPFFAKPDTEGAFVIAGVPAGSVRLVVYHMGGESRSVTVTVPASGAIDVKP